MLSEITDALRRGDVATALATARTFAAAEPDNPAAQHLLGVVLSQHGDRPGARAAFEHALAVAPDRPEAYFSLANLLLADGDHAGAARRLQEALTLDPNHLPAYVMLVHLALARGDRDEAARQLKLAQRVDPDHPQVRVAEGQVAQADGDLDHALRAYTAAAIAAPTLAAAQLALGNAYLAKGMWPFAEQALNNALELDPSRAPSTLRSLVEARRRQRKADDTLATLGELIALVPDDLVARALRADILTARGDAEDALADHLAILERRPAHPQAVLLAVRRLANSGRKEQALQIAETALARDPAVDDLWRARLFLGGMLGEDAKDVLDRWQDAAPDSAAVLDMLAGYCQQRGEDALAETYAARALAKNPALPTSVGVVLASEVREDPEAALARVDALLPGIADRDQQHTLLGWAGLALDALGRADEAAARWKEMIQRLHPRHLPPPPPLPAAPAGEGAGTLLFSPPGLRIEFLLQAMKRQLGPRLRLDRVGATADSDGFGLVRSDPGTPGAGSAERWHASLTAVGLDPATTIDWIPFVDGYTLQALQGARVVALLADPRDLLLNWLVHGSLQNFLFSNDAKRSAQWLAASLAALADFREAHPDRVHLVRMDRDAGKAETQLEQLLGLPQPLGALFGTGSRFPAGHWRRYAASFGEEFALLAPVAARLGYPVE